MYRYAAVFQHIILMKSQKDAHSAFIRIRLQRFLPPKMPFFVRQKVQISSKISPQIPNFASLQCTILVYLLKLSNFVKNQYVRHDGQFSSFHQFFVKNEIIRSLIRIKR